MPAFPPLDYSRYIWRTSPTDANAWVREPAGGEVIENRWNALMDGEQTLFCGAKASLLAPIQLDVMIQRARAAWCALRYDTPVIALDTENDEAANGLMIYRIAGSATEVTEWARRTIVPVDGTPDIDDLRFELSKKLLPDENRDQTFIYVTHHSNLEYDFLIHTSHVPFDGPGLKTLFTLFFNKLSKILTDGLDAAAYEKLPWGDEHKHLLPALSEALVPDPSLSEEIYDETLQEILSGLDTSTTPLYGFKERTFDKGPTRRISYTFSEQESQRILQACKENSYTINHVAQSALCYVTVLDNPPTDATPPDAAFVFFGTVDVRARLHPPLDRPEGYPSYALGLSAIRLLAAECAAREGESDKDAVLRTASVVKQQYLWQKAHPAIADVSVHELELIALSQKTMSSPPPPSTCPWFSADGIGEKYLRPAYSDAKGQPLIKINEFFISLNKTDPGPFFRVHTWCSKITLNADTNVNAMPPDVVQGFVNKWADLIRLVL